MKKKATGNHQLVTVWGEKFDRELVLPEYPRPFLFREKDWKNLNGCWNYRVYGPDKAAQNSENPREDALYDGEICVPFSPETLLSGVGRILNPGERGVYERTFLCPEAWKMRRTFLHFGAVDQTAEVFVNGQKAGEHRDGYLPFSLEITDLCEEGENLLTVSVTDETDLSALPKGKQRIERGGMWYTPQSGIWQTVWLESVPKVYIRDIHAVPARKLEGDWYVRIRVNLSEDTPGKVSLKLSRSGRTVLETEISQGVETELRIPDPELWSPEMPALYDLSACYGEDFVSSYFALRSFEIVTGKDGIPLTALNGKPYFCLGLLDQGYFPEGLYTAPSDEALVSDILKMKALGFNLLRKHAKIEPQRWYYHCDRLGMLVWQDFVNGGGPYSKLRLTYLPNIFMKGNRHVPDHFPWIYGFFGRSDKEGRQYFDEQMRETVRALGHSPAIVEWGPFNEGWGQFEANAATEKLRALDPTRLIDQASGWFDQKGGDFFSIHNYFRKLRIKPQKDGRAAALTESGGYSFYVTDHAYSESVYGYGEFQSREALTDRIEKLYREDLLPNIKNGLSVLVYTQVSDVEEEVNGLLTYDRKVLKVDEARMRKLNLELLDAFAREFGAS